VEAFEHLVKVAMEAEGLIVCGNLKFPVQRQTRKRTKELQTHGYEIDLVGARSELLVLSSVKSFFGSRGVSRQGFKGLADESKPHKYGGYKLFNYEDIREGVIEQASKRFGYPKRSIELRLYVGRFQNAEAKRAITEHLGKIVAGRGPIKVYDLNQILELVSRAANSKTYFNDPVIITVKAMTQYLREWHQSHAAVT
jgi:hypothetical protein